ncbi:CS1-pili formation C-terminal domain-containing protein [Pseudomonas turukhanskensis]|uniref:Pilus assembly protein C-terminal domain-containing protein n=1 Tax=Pseudomonas turukhanskensis TaxID=1806536 RepID=A0A9W6NGL0_9PSED|nr:CS1-pili formation C-terminal domain-containing protein [Pseudomonas turukhanskensis]GLK89816.1 hypothetical protein GCM10017655_28780 [Pseudomonas turukhanskensis]
MKIAKSTLAFALFVCAEAVRSANHEHVQVAFKKNSNFDTDPRYLPIALSINEAPSEAWLDITKNYRIIFNTETRTINDLSTALKSLRPARNLRYSCDTSPLPMCERYKFFNFSYDYDSGRFKVLYELANKSFAALESEPALVARQSVVYSESQGDNYTYRHGYWTADANAGVTENSSVYTNIYYDMAVGKLSAQSFSYNYDVSPLLQLSGYVQKGPTSDLVNLGVGSTKGISLQHSNEHKSEFDSQAEPIIIDAKYDGLVNIYDDVGKLIRSTQVMQGINRLDIPSSASGNTVRIEEVVDGRVVESYDRAISRTGNSPGMLRVDVGMASLRKDTTSQRSGDEPYIRYLQTLHGVSLGASALPTMGWYTTSLRFPSFKGLTGSIESTFKDKQTDHSVTAGYQTSIKGNDLYTSMSKQFGSRDSTSYSVGASRRISNDTRIDLFYNQSQSVYDPRRRNDYYTESRYSKPIVTAYKRVTSRLRTRHTTAVGIFDYSFYVSSELGDDKRIGASVTYTPAAHSNWFRPTVGVQSESGSTNSHVVNDMQITDRFQLRPEVRFADGKLNQYGSGARYTNEQFNSDFGYFKGTSSDRSFYVNADSYTFLSRHGMQAHSSPKTSALVFNNTAENNASGQPTNFNINNQSESITHNKLHHLDLPSDGTLIIYPETDNIALDPNYASLAVKPYRVHKVDYKHETDKIHVFGRVMLKGQPEAGVAVVNHASKTVTDKNGYFSLTVSRSEPSIALYRRGQECAGINNLLVDRDKNSNEIYLGRLQCDI